MVDRVLECNGYYRIAPHLSCPEHREEIMINQHEFYKDEKIGWSGIVEEIFQNKQISTHVTHEIYTVKITGFLSHILLMKKKKDSHPFEIPLQLPNVNIVLSFENYLRILHIIRDCRTSCK